MAKSIKIYIADADHVHLMKPVKNRSNGFNVLFYSVDRVEGVLELFTAYGSPDLLIMEPAIRGGLALMTKLHDDPRYDFPTCGNRLVGDVQGKANI